jgi:hypothetical protein
MNEPDNPYTAYSSTQAKAPEQNKGSILKGFLIGMGLIILCYVLGVLIIVLIEREMSFGLEELLISAIITACSPIVISSAVMLYHGLKGQIKTVIGNALAIGLLLAFALLIFAACYTRLI